MPFFQLLENKYTPLITKDLAQRESDLLAQAIFQIRGETRKYDHSTGLRLSGSRYITQNFPVLDLTKPLCQTRNAYSVYASRMLCTFFWLHELVHATHGHLDILSNSSGNSNVTLAEFPEWAQTSPGPLSALPEHLPLAMEYDADVEALIATLGLILDGLDTDEEEYLTDVYEKAEEFVFFVIASFGAIAEHAKRSHLHEGTSHPPFKFRFLNLLKYLLAFSSKDEALDQAVKHAVAQAQEAAEDLRFGFLLEMLDVDDADLHKWNNIDTLRECASMRQAADLYGNMRQLGGSVLDKMRGTDFWEEMQPEAANGIETA